MPLLKATIENRATQNKLMRFLLLTLASFVTLTVFGQTINKGGNLHHAFEKSDNP